MKFTGERQVGRSLSEIESLHKDRYRWALARIKGSEVLDCACGVGYGSWMLVQEKPEISICAVDISRESIEFAKKYYLHPRIYYDSQNMIELKSEKSFDTIISLETLEHVRNPEQVLDRFRVHLKKNGNIIASLPSHPTVSYNRFHQFEIQNIEHGISFFKLCGYRVVEFFNQNNRYGLFHLVQ